MALTNQGSPYLFNAGFIILYRILECKENKYGYCVILHGCRWPFVCKITVIKAYLILGESNKVYNKKILFSKELHHAHHADWYFIFYFSSIFQAIKPKTVSDQDFSRLVIQLSKNAFYILIIVNHRINSKNSPQHQALTL